MRLFPPRRRDIPQPYEGADMPTSSDHLVDAEATLRALVRSQRERIRDLEEELARVNSMVYQLVGE